MPDLPQHFAETLALLNVSDADGNAWRTIRLRYSEPGRHYHNLEHISQCLDELARTPHDIPLLRLAIYFHDIVYDPCGDDNEMLSARFATEQLHALGLPDTITSVVYDLIRATDHRPGAPVPHGDLVCDIDLAILGSPPIDYHTYSNAIRREYSWLPESRYRRGRTNILTNLLDRPSIYLTGEFQRSLEDQARINLVTEITELRGRVFRTMRADKHLLAAEGYFELDMFEDALEELDIAAHVPGNRKIVRRRRLEVFIATKRWNEAHRLAKDLHEDNPDNPTHRIQHAFVLRELDRVEEARGILLDGSPEFQRSALFHYNLGCYEALLGNPAAALKSLQRAFRSSPELRLHADTDRDLDSIRNQLPPAA